VAKVALRFGCAKQSKNLEWYLLYIEVSTKCGRFLCEDFLKMFSFHAAKYQIDGQATEGHPVANSVVLPNARKNHCSVIVIVS
jgi:hypothetical protein